MNLLLPDLGIGFVWTALALFIVSVITYIRAANSTSAAVKLGAILPRLFFICAVICVIGIAIVHSTLLLTHRFDINYVYRYSDRALSTPYLFATFWAGQEGSFLLWAFWTSILGVILASTLPKDIEQRTMSVYGCVLIFLLTLLAIRSPFTLYHPLSPMDPQGIPTDGVGLNPLLENPWVVVHPPTLFLGLSSLTIPFAIAAGALIWKKQENWLAAVSPWALFGFAVLGCGIMMGGYWAYEVLGWGGFWGWDPVEIGPFVPWLFLGGFVHSAQAMRSRGSMKRTACLLAMLPFVLAVYETFLTRTGILEKFSVHSFSSLGGVANSVVLYGLLTATLFAFGIFVWRWKSLKDESNPLENAVSRDFAMTIAVGLLLLCALISGIGMSAPLITQGAATVHWVSGQSSVQPDFYNKANFPVACLILLGMAIGPYLVWRETPKEKLDPLSWIYPAAVVVSIAFVVVSRTLIHSNTSVPLLLMFACCMLSVFANGWLLIGHLRNGPSLMSNLRVSGGAVAHIGAALLLLGVVFLVSWYRVDDQPLVQGHSRQVSGIPMTMTYVGSTSSLTDPNNRLKIAVLEGPATDKQVSYTAYMPLAVRSNEGQLEIVARPAIIHRWWGDLYFAFKGGPDQISPTPVIKGSITEGGETTIAGYKIDVGNFSADPVAAAEARSGHMPSKFPVTIPLTVTSPTGQVKEVDAQYIQYFNNPLGDTSPEVKLPRSNDDIPWALAVQGINADTHVAQVYIRDSAFAPVDAYTIEVSTRPMVWLVWLGTIMVTLGGFMSMRRRAIEGKVEADKALVELPAQTDAPRRQNRRPSAKRERVTAAEAKVVSR